MELASEKMKFLIHTDVLLLDFVSVFQKKRRRQGSVQSGHPGQMGILGGVYKYKKKKKKEYCVTSSNKGFIELLDMCAHPSSLSVLLVDSLPFVWTVVLVFLAEPLIALPAGEQYWLLVACGAFTPLLFLFWPWLCLTGLRLNVGGGLWTSE